MYMIRIIFGLAVISGIIVFTGFPGAWKSGFLLFSLGAIAVLAWRASKELKEVAPKKTGDTFTESHQ